MDCSLAGSSPPARGTQRCAKCRRAGDRFIPARAGNTRKDHKVDGLTYGSSPPARGTHDRDAHLVAKRRFIPARAGNTGTADGS